MNFLILSILSPTIIPVEFSNLQFTYRTCITWSNHIAFMDLARPNPIIYRNLAQTPWTHFLAQVKLSFYFNTMFFRKHIALIASLNLGLSFLGQY